MKRGILSKGLGFVLVLVLALAMQSFELVGITAENSTEGLVAHYTFDGDLKDSSGNGLDAEKKGGVTFEEGVPGLGKSARFGSGYALVSDNNLLDFDKAFTISMWIRAATDVDKILQNQTMILL